MQSTGQTLTHPVSTQSRQRRVMVQGMVAALAAKQAADPSNLDGWLRLGHMQDRAEKLLAEFDVRGGGAEAYAAALSGGNQQKVAIAREIACNPKVLVAHQPTRGLDVGAIEFVHRRLIAERDKGRAVLLVSLEYEEVKALADRILVIYEGKIVGEFSPDASEERLGIAMTGGKAQQAKAAS